VPQRDLARARDLLERYIPVIQYDSQESYAADSVATMTDRVPPGSPQGNLLRRRDGTVLAAAAPSAGQARLSLDLLAAERYTDDDATPVEPDDYLDAVESNTSSTRARCTLAQATPTRSTAMPCTTLPVLSGFSTGSFSTTTTRPSCSWACTRATGR
jgi:hypothetical protein